MDIFGIGAPELVFLVLLALILLGPKEMQKTGRTIGRFLRDLTRSEGWRAFRDTSREIRNLPNRLMREANLEDVQKDVGQIGKEVEEATTVKGFGTWSNPAAGKPAPHQTGSKPVEASEKPTPPQTEPKPAEDSEKPAPQPEPDSPSPIDSDQETNQNA
jgi:sec-independent protein translocase protein TatB